MMNKMLNQACNKYEQSLWQSAEALNYLVKERGLTEGIIKDNHLGYAKGNLVQNELSSQNSEYLDLGIVTSLSQDFFEGYITFPIIENDKYVNIYGRGLGDVFPTHKTLPNIPKDYLYNSNALSKKGVVIVESPIDCLTLLQNGFNSCAIMGTKFSINAVYKFKGMTCYILFDKDSSGEYGAELLASKLFKVASKVCILEFPGKPGVKLDANLYFARTKTAPERLKFLIKNAQPLKVAPFPLREEKKEKKEIRDWAEDKVSVVEVGRKLFKNEVHIDKGTELWVRCPHHKEGNEKNKSLWVGGKNNIFYCFGCQRGGGPIVFVSWHLKLSFDKSREWIKNNILQFSE